MKCVIKWPKAGDVKSGQKLKPDLSSVKSPSLRVRVDKPILTRKQHNSPLVKGRWSQRSIYPGAKYVPAPQEVDKSI